MKTIEEIRLEFYDCLYKPSDGKEHTLQKIDELFSIEVGGEAEGKECISLDKDYDGTVICHIYETDINCNFCEDKKLRTRPRTLRDLIEEGLR